MTPRTPAAARLADKIDRSGGEDACWPFTGYVSRYGYGHIAGGEGEPTTMRAHVVAYEAAHGPLPPEYTVGHTCHDLAVLDGSCPGGDSCLHRRCCNDRHLAAQTPGQQSAAAAHAQKDRCLRGHEFTEANTYRDAKGKRSCRECRRDAARKSYWKGRT